MNIAQRPLRLTLRQVGEEEVMIKTKGGHKDTRYVDLQAKKDGKTLNVQVGKSNKNKTPVIRERKAITDINANSTKSTRTVFVPYNK